jgi:periplasmic protein TonB
MILTRTLIWLAIAAAHSLVLAVILFARSPQVTPPIELPMVVQGVLISSASAQAVPPPPQAAPPKSSEAPAPRPAPRPVPVVAPPPPVPAPPSERAITAPVAAAKPQPPSPPQTQPSPESKAAPVSRAAHSDREAEGAAHPEKGGAKTSGAPEKPGAPVTLPRVEAGQLGNPVPGYPPMSRRLGEQGQVLLEVLILADGSVGEIRLKTSSRYQRLDDSALKAVKKWRYLPARRGNTPIAYWYVQPINFNLQN